MKKYEIKRNTAELNKKSEVREGVTIEQDNQDPEVLESFDTIEEARKTLKNYKSSCEKVEGYHAAFYRVTEIYIEENVYDEDDEWIDGGDVWAFAENE